LSGGLAAPLHPEVIAMLEAQRNSGARPRSEWTVEETRAAMLAGRAWQQAPPAGVPVRNAVAGGVPVRLYGAESAEALLFAHGGRFFSGDLESHDWPLRLLASLATVRICAVDYRLAPEHQHPAAVDDVVAAGRWLAAESDSILTGGDSAGGYLAAMASLALQPRRQLLIYPMLDPACDTDSYRDYWQGPWPAGEDMQRGWQLYQGPPVRAAAGPFPPTLLVTAGVDPLRDEALAFAAALRAAAVPVSAHHFSDMPHGFFTQTRLARSRELLTLLGKWLSQSAKVR
jgi:acetyl esterase